MIVAQAPGTMRAVDRIAVHVAPFEWGFATAEAARIDAHWSHLRAAKPALFDGAVLMSRCIGVAADEGGAVLHGEAFETRYKPFLCWRDFGWPDGEVHNLFAMAALRAADGPFLLGRMGAATANAGKLYFPAGTPEPGDARADEFVDFDANILRELEEETGLGASDIVPDAAWTVVFDGPLVACMKIVRSPLTADALIGRVAAFVASQAEPELDGLVAVRGPSDLEAPGMLPFMRRYLAWALERP